MGRIVPGQRQRHLPTAPKRGIHELKDPAKWPAEPLAIANPLDAERFDAAVIKLCAEVAQDEGLPDVARAVREVSTETGADPFLMAALVYRQGRCRPGLVSVSGIGLLQIKPSMFAAGARLPFPRADLDASGCSIPRTTCASARRCWRCGTPNTPPWTARCGARRTAPRSRTSSGATRCGGRRSRIAP